MSAKSDSGLFAGPPERVTALPGSGSGYCFQGYGDYGSSLGGSWFPPPPAEELYGRMLPYGTPLQIAGSMIVHFGKCMEYQLHSSREETAVPKT